MQLDLKSALKVLGLTEREVLQSFEVLTDREKEVAEMVARDAKPFDIASALNTTPATVYCHLANLKRAFRGGTAMIVRMVLAANLIAQAAKAPKKKTLAS